LNDAGIGAVRGSTVLDRVHYIAEGKEVDELSSLHELQVWAR